MPDELGARMKHYEAAERFEPGLPIIVRIDGKNFSGYTRRMDRPWDRRLTEAMQETAKWLVAETNARIGYTQSDEITLILWEDDPKSQVFFDGKVQKIVSVLAAMASVRFNKEIRARFDRELPDAYFDARAHTVPDQVEAANVLLWRQLDAVRNSVSMLAHHHFSHRSLLNKSVPEMLAMLAEKSVLWDTFPSDFTHGTAFARQQVLRGFTDEELARIPEFHRPEPGAVFKRSVVQRVPLLPRWAPIEERVAFIFGSPPEMEKSA